MAYKLKLELDIEDAKKADLDDFLQNVINADLPDGQAPYPNLESYCAAILQPTFDSWQIQGKQKKDKERQERYDAAAPDVKAQVDALLEGGV